VLKSQVGTKQEFVAFLLELRREIASADTLALLNGHPIMAKPKHRSKRVQLVRFRHGEYVQKKVA
jgi:hypothetical protein